MGCNNSSAVCVKRTRINQRNAQKVLKQNDSYDVITSDSQNIQNSWENVNSANCKKSIKISKLPQNFNKIGQKCSYTTCDPSTQSSPSRISNKNKRNSPILHSDIIQQSLVISVFNGIQRDQETVIDRLDCVKQ